MLLFAACAAHLAPYDPYEQNLELSLLPPSAAHWMGTDAIVPAAVGTYRIVPEEGEMIKMLVASVG